MSKKVEKVCFIWEVEFGVCEVLRYDIFVNSKATLLSNNMSPISEFLALWPDSNSWLKKKNLSMFQQPYIAYAGGWSLLKPLSFDLPYSKLFLNSWPQVKTFNHY